MKSEEFQTIRRMHTPSIKTEFGDRCMTALGVIKGLEIDDTANYLLIPTRCEKDGKEVTTAWMIHKLTKECEAEVEDWNNLEKTKANISLIKGDA